MPQEQPRIAVFRGKGSMSIGPIDAVTSFVTGDEKRYSSPVTMIQGHAFGMALEQGMTVGTFL